MALFRCGNAGEKSNKLVGFSYHSAAATSPVLTFENVTDVIDFSIINTSSAAVYTLAFTGSNTVDGTYTAIDSKTYTSGSLQTYSVDITGYKFVKLTISAPAQGDPVIEFA